MRKTYVLDPITRELVEKKYFYTPQASYIQGDIEPVISPVDGTIIGSRSKLREHNAKNGVVPYEEFGDAYFAKAKAERWKRAQGQTPQDKKERIEALKYAYEKHSRR
jgi:hypothetical protein